MVQALLSNPDDLLLSYQEKWANELKYLPLTNIFKPGMLVI